MAETQISEKIGEFLVRIEALTQQQVDEILTIQAQDPSKLFGIIAIELGYIDDKAIKAYIDSKRVRNKE
ncbi:MAG: hypothetical protein JW904_05225 [Spirochaetales bacterium]|nr:hypothetical protein [Spirochaetales bacterium]